MTNESRVAAETVRSYIRIADAAKPLGESFGPRWEARCASACDRIAADPKEASDEALSSPTAHLMFTETFLEGVGGRMGKAASAIRKDRRGVMSILSRCPDHEYAFAVLRTESKAVLPYGALEALGDAGLIEEAKNHDFPNAAVRVLIESHVPMRADLASMWKTEGDAAASLRACMPTVLLEKGEPKAQNT